MRTLRLSLAGTVIVALLVGVTGVALAQDPEEVTWTHVTGQTNMDDDWVELEPIAEPRSDGSVEYYEPWTYIMPMEWSDPRLGESMQLREGTVLHQGDLEDWSDDLWVFARAVRLDGPEGAWAGTARGVAANDLSTTQLLYELTGEGAYEGLSAVFSQDNSGWPLVTFDGWIFEGDLPTMPDPVEPAATDEPEGTGEAVTEATEEVAAETTEQPGAALAEEDAHTPKVTHFTGSRVGTVPDETNEEWWFEDGVEQSRMWVLDETVDWSDPRLPSDKQNVVNLAMYNPHEFREVMMRGTTLLNGPDGYWTGEFTSYCDEDSSCHGMTTITGHGAYEGLFAVFHDPAGTDTDPLYEGIIFEGEMPPMPDPIEPPVE